VPPLSLPVECLGIEDGVLTDRPQKLKYNPLRRSGLELVKFQPRWKEPPQKLLEGGGSVLIEMITPRRHLDWEFRQLRLTEGRAMTLARALFKAVGDGQEEDALSMLKRIDGELPKSGGSLIKEAAWRGADPKMREGIEKNYVNSAFNCRRVSS
ncbi:MAG TPA: hypothetical protein VLE89_08185, partial [Chlamydiales bacterium]|nr:hypothetical protein [Chlamydiales bacterium]